MPLIPAPIYRALLRRSLAAYYPLDEASGTRRDLLGLNPLTSNNAVGTTAGQWGPAALFVAASSQYLSHADTAALRITPTTGWTVDGWVRITSASGSFAFVAKSNTGNNGEYQLYCQANNWAWLVKDNSANNTVDATGAPPTVANTWTYVCGWYDPVHGQLGIQVDTNPPLLKAVAFTPATSAQEFRLGARANGSLLLDGALQHVGLWSRVLSDRERLARARGVVLL